MSFLLDYVHHPAGVLISELFQARQRTDRIPNWNENSEFGQSPGIPEFLKLGP